VGRFYSRAELIEQRRRWKRQGKTVVFTNGCYDLLHPATYGSSSRPLTRRRSHSRLELRCQYAARQGAGPAARPEQERAELALALEAVDAVTLFDEATPRDLIASVLPDVLVKGADWSHFVAGPGKKWKPPAARCLPASGTWLFYY